MIWGKNIEDQEALKTEANRYFKKLFTEDPHISPTDQLNLVQLFPHFISTEDSTHIDRSVTKQ
jgi:hypothetical protein